MIYRYKDLVLRVTNIFYAYFIIKNIDDTIFVQNS